MTLLEELAKALREAYYQTELGQEPTLAWEDLPAHRQTKWLDLATVAIRKCQGALNVDPLLSHTGVA